MVVAIEFVKLLQSVSNQFGYCFIQFILDEELVVAVAAAAAVLGSGLLAPMGLRLTLPAILTLSV